MQIVGSAVQNSHHGDIVLIDSVKDQVLFTDDVPDIRLDIYFF